LAHSDVNKSDELINFRSIHWLFLNIQKGTNNYNKTVLTYFKTSLAAPLIKDISNFSHCCYSYTYGWGRICKWGWTDFQT